jgi:hypothetical protein
MAKKLEDVETRSEEVQELLGSVPSWITRYGFSLLFVLLGLLVAGSWFFKYPDLVSAPVVVTTINSEGKKVLIGQIRVAANKTGKVKPGQRVNLKFDSYPYMEYGLVKGVVARILDLPVQSYYIVEVTLPDQLVSTFGKKIAFQQELDGTAEIITDDQRLLNRILQPVSAIFSERIAK